MRLCLVLFVLFVGISSVSAEENRLEAAKQLVWQGDYQKAILSLSGLKEYQPSLLEAEVRLIRYSTGFSYDIDDELDKAQQAALRALSLQPKAVQPRYSLIAVIGYRARSKSLFTGLRKKWASKGRKLIDETLLLEPDNPWSHAMSGNWNLEILRRTSKRRAKLVGASIKGGLDGCSKALALAPDNTHITAQCGLALLIVEDPALDALGLQALEMAAKAVPANDAFTCLRQQQAAQILELRTNGQKRAARKLVKSILLAKKVTDWPRQCEQSSQSVNDLVFVPDIQD
ncbi:MAG: hypothetical protein JKY46_05510 [Robiginitomaculum sp.]|nr:hypothetical protein [Robiginitomaculum sp.]